MEMIRLFKPIPEMDERIYVSTHGEFISYRKTRKHLKSLKVQTTFRGYKALCLYRKGKYKRVFAYRVVARVFIGERPENHVVNHIDADKSNNFYQNLEYVTHQQNLDHARRLNRITSGEVKYNATLSNKKRLEIYQSLLHTKSYITVAKELNVKIHDVSNIAQGKSAWLRDNQKDYIYNMANRCQ